MNIYLVTNIDNNCGYDSFDSMVVIAPDEDYAKQMNPQSGFKLKPEDWDQMEFDNSWARNKSYLESKFIGTCEDTTPSLVLASFNAG
jgi:hypothetical protein